LKLKSLGAFFTATHAIAHQESILLWLSEGDTPTRFFHIQTNSRCCKHVIYPLEQNGQVLVAKDHKAAAIFPFFDEILGASPTHSKGINLDLLDLLLLSVTPYQHS
jgi:hypothetical protein